MAVAHPNQLDQRIIPMRVLKPITTPLHHFPEGVDVSPEEIDGPLTVAEWQELGHLEAPAKPAKTSKVAPSVAPADPALSD